ncbi:MAG: ABC transporter substrate-binding protein [Rhizobium pusense]|nr:ABC transporter substrate-binding protein [Agrobacterium pusense]
MSFTTIRSPRVAAWGRNRLRSWFIQAALTALTITSVMVSAVTANASGSMPFPVTVEHAFGSTTVRSEPQRILTFGWSSEDIAIALGKPPLWMPRRPIFQSGIAPWNEEQLSGKKPTLFTGIYLDFEEVARLRPDLILAVSSGINANDYRMLSRIAPTIVYRSGPWQAGLEEQTELVGVALGRPNDAANLLTKVERVLATARAENPILTGKTFAIGTYFDGFSVYLSADPRVAAFEKLGLKLTPGIASLSTRYPHKTLLALSAEQIDRLDADILIMWYTGGNKSIAEQQPLFRTLKVVENGSYVALTDPASVWAMSALSVLSIPYEVPRLVPRLAQAADRAEKAGGAPHE